MQKLHLYNTLTRQKEEFESIEKDIVRLYTCGPTVYNYAHIGNLRTYVFEDILRRSLEYFGYEVRHIMNITDVGHLTSDADSGEDKMEKGSKREGKTAWEIAEFYSNAFKKDLTKLNLLEPKVWARATDFIEEQINLIKKLEEKGVTYVIDDGVYFDTSKFPKYAGLAKLDIEGLQEGARVEKNTQKRNATDFALWKFSPAKSQRAMEWKSPWGIGFPGWHIECSAIAMKYLGETIDIHCGGIDHIPVHHTNEIAQSETVTGKKFANFWMHGEHLNIEIGDKAEKMSKSGDYFITLETLMEKGYDPIPYRYLLLTGHYRTKMQFSWKSLDAATTAFHKLQKHYYELPDSNETPDSEIKEKFEKIIADDLNCPQAIALIWDILKDNKISDTQKKALIRNFDQILGLDLNNYKPENIPEQITKLAKKRIQARTEKNWELSDQIRDQITELGYKVEDTEGGYKTSKL